MDKASVEKIIDEKIRPFLQRDGGNIEIIDVKDDSVFVRLQGACTSCPSSMMTLRMGVERILREAFPSMKELVPLS